jgi:hypothetical protein
LLPYGKQKKINKIKKKYLKNATYGVLPAGACEAIFLRRAVLLKGSSLLHKKINKIKK